MTGQIELIARLIITLHVHLHVGESDPHLLPRAKGISGCVSFTNTVIYHGLFPIFYVTIEFIGHEERRQSRSYLFVLGTPPAGLLISASGF